MAARTPSLSSTVDRDEGCLRGNKAAWISSEVCLPARRTTMWSPSSSHSSTEPGASPSFRRTSAGTEICPCAVIGLPQPREGPLTSKRNALGSTSGPAPPAKFSAHLSDVRQSIDRRPWCGNCTSWCRETFASVSANTSADDHHGERSRDNTPSELTIGRT